MNRLKEKIRSRRGSAPLWTGFIAIVLISFSLLIYTGMILQINYRQAQNELERAASIALDINLKNEVVRDILLTIPLENVQNSLEHNLQTMDYQKIDQQSWQRTKASKTIYTLENLVLKPDGEQIILTGDLSLSLLWGNQLTVRIPIRTTVQVIFIDLS